MAMFINGKIAEIEEDKPISISIREELESNEEQIIKLSQIPIGPVFFREPSGNKITNIETSDQQDEFIAPTPFMPVIADYEYSYENGGDIITIGQRFMDGYLSLEGKTRVKDDITGQTHTGILKIPRLKLMSDLSMKLGQMAGPVVGNFNAIAYPVGSKGSKVAMELVILNDDIDSDM